VTQNAQETVKPVLHHVNLKTVRMQEMIEWYGLVVGMEPMYVYETGAWLSNDTANHRIAFISVPGLEDDPDKLSHTGIHHTAFEYESADDLISTYDRLRDVGIVPHGCLDHGMTTSFYYQDPDGNSVELQADNFGDWSTSSQFVRESPEFDANPIGVNIDPEQLSKARAEGLAAAEIHRRGYAGEFEPAEPLNLRLPSAD
jgi:catechol 2,3-dioxygenase